MKKNQNLKTIDLGSGNPTFLHDYWARNHVQLSILDDDYLPYHHGNVSDLVDKIVKTHREHKNVNLDGHYDIVITSGATQALHAAMFAFRSLGYVSVHATAPYWFRLPELANLLGMGWNTANRSGRMRIVTTPNNPDNTQPALSRREKHVLVDCCYNWPQYTKDVQCIDQLVTVFSLAKMTGNAGTRIGWAVVKDKRVAALMKLFVEQSCGGVSLEAQYRACRILDNELSNRTNHTYDIISYGLQKMQKRWEHLMAVMPVEITALNDTTCGMFAWCKVKKGDGAKYFRDRYNVIALPGPASGSTREHFRVSIGCTDEEFFELIRRLTLL